MNTSPRQKFIASVWEKLKGLPDYAEIFVSGEFLIGLGLLSLALLLHILIGSFSVYGRHP